MIAFSPLQKDGQKVETAATTRFGVERCFSGSHTPSRNRKIYSFVPGFRPLEFTKTGDRRRKKVKRKKKNLNLEEVGSLGRGVAFFFFFSSFSFLSLRQVLTPASVAHSLAHTFSVVAGHGTSLGRAIGSSMRSARL